MEQNTQQQEQQTQLKPVRYYYNDEELVKLGSALVEGLKEQGRIEAEKSLANNGFKQQLAEVDESISHLRDKISDGYEVRDVECEVKYHTPSKNQKTWINPFTKDEIVEEMDPLDHNLFNLHKEDETDEGSEETLETPTKGRGKKKKTETPDNDTF